MWSRKAPRSRPGNHLGRLNDGVIPVLYYALLVVSFTQTLQVCLIVSDRASIDTEDQLLCGYWALGANAHPSDCCIAKTPRIPMSRFSTIDNQCDNRVSIDVVVFNHCHRFGVLVAIRKVACDASSRGERLHLSQIYWMVTPMFLEDFVSWPNAERGGRGKIAGIGSTMQLCAQIANRFGRIRDRTLVRQPKLPLL